MPHGERVMRAMRWWVYRVVTRLTKVSEWKLVQRFRRVLVCSRTCLFVADP